MTRTALALLLLACLPAQAHDSWISHNALHAPASGAVLEGVHELVPCAESQPSSGGRVLFIR